MKPFRVLLAAVAVSFACAAPLQAGEPAGGGSKGERERISADAKAAREKCKDLKANEKDICMAEARGQEKVAKAELALKEKDTPKNRYELAAAKADFEYNIAKEKCDDMKGKDKQSCRKQARDARDTARKSAKAERDAAEPKKESTAKKDGGNK